jgi:ubiquinone/menaquinone biosynthesis C-methylase UbiE
VFEAYWAHLDGSRRKQYSEGDRPEYGAYVVYQGNRLLARHLPVRPGARWLEIGCGRADVSLYFAKRGIRACVMDPGPMAARLARRNFLEEGCVPWPVQGDGFALSFRDGTFDESGCSGVLEHLMGCEAVVQEMARVVKPGGTCFAAIQVFTQLTVQSLVATLVRMPLAFLRGLCAGGLSAGVERARRYRVRSFPVNPARLADYRAMFTAAGLREIRSWNVNFFPALRLRGWSERGYVRLMQAVLGCRAALDVREPFATRLGGGTVWVLLGTKPTT